MHIVGLTFEEAPAPVFACPVCGKVYKNEDAMKKHIKEKHPEYEGVGAAPAADPEE